MDVRLHERPEAEARSVERLLARIKKGQLRVPRFQRALRWKSRHVIELFDSLYRGFPVGELLLSRQPGPSEVVRFGPVVIQAQARSDALFIVDGQQRVVSLAGALLHPDVVPRGDVHAIWFDLEKEEFFRLISAPKATWLPMNVIADSATLLQWLHDWPLQAQRKDLVERAIAVGKAIREYEVPAYVVSNANEQTLRTIFSRVNTAGVDMRESEVFDALFGHDDHKPLEEACGHLSSEGFGTFDEKWLLSSLKAVAEIDPKQRVTSLDEALRARPDALLHTTAALRRVLGFLAADAGILHADFLPYAMVMPILALFFHRFPSPGARTRQLLVRWVWRGALSGEHARNSHANLKRLTDQIGGDESESVQFLIEHVDAQWSRPIAGARWSNGTAHTRLLALVLLSLRPRSPRTGAEYSLDEVLQAEHPIHAFVNIREPKKHSGDAAAFIVGPGSLVKTRKALLDQWSGATSAVLASHGLDRDMLRDLAAGHDDSFLVARAAMLDAAAQRVFEARAGVHDDDRPSIAEITKRVRHASVHA